MSARFNSESDSKHARSREINYRTFDPNASALASHFSAFVCVHQMRIRAEEQVVSSVTCGKKTAGLHTVYTSMLRRYRPPKKKRMKHDMKNTTTIIQVTGSCHDDGVI